MSERGGKQADFLWSKSQAVREMTAVSTAAQTGGDSRGETHSVGATLTPALSLGALLLGWNLRMQGGRLPRQTTGWNLQPSMAGMQGPLLREESLGEGAPEVVLKGLGSWRAL